MMMVSRMLRVVALRLIHATKKDSSFLQNTGLPSGPMHTLVILRLCVLSLLAQWSSLYVTFSGPQEF